MFTRRYLLGEGPLNELGLLPAAVRVLDDLMNRWETYSGAGRGRVACGMDAQRVVGGRGWGRFLSYRWNSDKRVDLPVLPLLPS